MLVAVAQLLARNLADRDAALDDVIDAIAAAAEQGAELVVLPECSWPAYVLGGQNRPGWTAAEQSAAEARIAAATRDASLVSVVGLAAHRDGVLRNIAIVHDPDGSRAGEVAKRFLWDIDQRWFVASENSAPVDTAVGRLGVFVCADGRMPEIARSLCIAGAELLVDPTAWVTPSIDPRVWSNPQHDFMLAARAWENRRSAVAANKVGHEEGVASYCGRSLVVDADGHPLVSASSEVAELVVADVAVAVAEPRGTRPKSAAVLTTPTPQLPAWSRRGAALTLLARPRLVVHAATDEPSPRARQVVADLAADLIVSAGPRLCGRTPCVRWEVSNSSVMVVDGGAPATERVITDDGGVRSVALNGLPVAVVTGGDLEGPEHARIAMLRGADVLIWFGQREQIPEVVLRARAAENRIFVVAVDPTHETPWALVVNPDGSIVARTSGDRPVAVVTLALADARAKEMAPGTDVVGGRQPASYEMLARTRSRTEGAAP